MLFSVPQDALVAFALGEALALSAAKELTPASRLWERPFKEALLYFGAVFVPVSYSFFHLWPDWSLLYLLDTNTAPPLLPFVAFLAVFAAGALGFALGHGLLRRGARGAALAVLALGIAGAGAWLVVFPERLLQVGSYEEFFAGEGRSFFEAQTLAQTGVALLFCALGFFLVVRSQHRRARMARAEPGPLSGRDEPHHDDGPDGGTR